MHVVYDMILLLVFLLQISTSVWAPNVAQIGPVDLYHRLHLWTITWYIFISNQSSSRLGVFLSSARYKFTVYQLIYLLTGRDVESHNGAQKKKTVSRGPSREKIFEFCFLKMVHSGVLNVFERRWNPQTSRGAEENYLFSLSTGLSTGGALQVRSGRRPSFVVPWVAVAAAAAEVTTGRRLRAQGLRMGQWVGCRVLGDAPPGPATSSDDVKRCTRPENASRTIRWSSRCSASSPWSSRPNCLWLTSTTRFVCYVSLSVICGDVLERDRERKNSYSLKL